MDPAIWSMTFAYRDLLIATGFWSRIAIISGDERLASPFHSLFPPVVLASDPTSHRIFTGDGEGRISELIIDPVSMKKIACSGLQDTSGPCH